MLVAVTDGMRIEAWAADKGPQYTCPNCHDEVTLKKGAIVIHHFAHKPPTSCTWATGETREHLLAKTVIRDAFRARGHQADVEVEVLSSAGDRRADVLLSNARGVRVAVEIQHTPILYDAIERRTCAYVAAKLPVMWIGILSKKMKKDAITTLDGLVIHQHAIRPWEKWAHAYCFKQLWYIDPDEQVLWKGIFSDHMIDKEITSWYNEYGEEQSAGGYSYPSKKWKTLKLSGPHPISTIDIGFKGRKEWQSKAFNLPAGRIAFFR